MAAGEGSRQRGIRRRDGRVLTSSTATFTQLDCGCLRAGGRIGDELHCARHRRVAFVIQAAPEWCAACVTCTWTKPTGLAGVTAEVEAARHARRRQHRVQIWHGAQLDHEVGPRAPGQMTLFPEQDSTRDA